MLIDVPSHAHRILFRVQSFFTIEEPRAGEWKTRREQWAWAIAFFFSAISLKRSKIDTSQNVKVSFATKFGDRRARASCSRTRVSSDGSGKKTRPSGALEKAGVEVKGR